MKKILPLVLAAALLAGCQSPAPQEEPRETQSFALVAPVPVSVETEFQGYDLTGDGQADTLSIRCLEPEDYGTKDWKDWGNFGYHWQILVNGEPAMELRTDWPVRPEAALYPVSPERQYLAICQRLDTNDDIGDFGLYQYSGGRLEQVCDFYCDNLDSRHVFHYDAELVCVAGDRILLHCANQFNATAYLHWEMEFLYEDGGWRLAGNEYPVVYEDYMEDKADGMTANQPLVIYTAPDCAQIAFTMEKGGQAVIHRLRIEDGQAYFYLTDGEGRSGWLKDPPEVYANIDGEDLFGCFEEAIFAG